MIDYATYRHIHHLHEVDKLTLTQIARQLGLHPQTVRHWLDEPVYRPRKTPPPCGVRGDSVATGPDAAQALCHYPFCVLDSS